MYFMYNDIVWVLFWVFKKIQITWEPFRSLLTLHIFKGLTEVWSNRKYLYKCSTLWYVNVTDISNTTNLMTPEEFTAIHVQFQHFDFTTVWQNVKILLTILQTVQTPIRLLLLGAVLSRSTLFTWVPLCQYFASF